MRKLHLFTNKSPESSINQFRFVFFGVRELFCVVLGQFSAVQLKLNSVSGSFFVIQHFEKMKKKEPQIQVVLVQRRDEVKVQQKQPQKISRLEQIHEISKR